MSSLRQQARQKICCHVAEIKADLRRIERTTLSLSKDDIALIANGVAIRFNLIIAIYNALGERLPGPESSPENPMDLKLKDPPSMMKG